MITQLDIHSVCVQLQRKAIKNLYIRVLPPDGQVNISAPLRMSETTIRSVVIERLPWIKKQQDKFSQAIKQKNVSTNTDELIYLWGKTYRLEFIEHIGRHKEQVFDDNLCLYIKPNSTIQNKALVLEAFYRAELKNELEKMLVDWQKIMGVTASSFGIKRMKTRWGSCNTGTKKIWFNLELAKKPMQCVEYVLVHELAHLLEPSHNHRFKAYMSQFLPDWQERKALLNAIPMFNEVCFDEES
ncbi:MAG TPA: SprT family zinc-dependent metalloprotease [Agitococcus sp.]|nr:SprT family zinc-dependent metalloprotease [Agitococcus sp.]HMY01099.1 SprT family zinc-dependent metalloprotease [Agitococcus sp.]HMY29273.1 SprT family zinc-dependent metalloprotease [Agitococcus sp.]HNA22216.1 SprT family zinc-dependent metalloprotease [Agitococcus sp.]HNB20170.1 SprT family zinc-dependent metalloprotease [Agitococcus sp.]